jgi:hypothetical protein
MEYGMDGARFDNITRVAQLSRRRALGLMLSAFAAGLLRDSPVAASQESADPFSRAGETCKSNYDCGALAPCKDGYCTPVGCLIDGAVYLTRESRPATPCITCSPTKQNWTTWQGTLQDGEPCHAPDGAQCLSATGVCKDLQCVRDSQLDGAGCGAFQVCCHGSCCDQGEICGEFGCEAHKCAMYRMQNASSEIQLDNPCELFWPL